MKNHQKIIYWKVKGVKYDLLRWIDTNALTLITHIDAKTAAAQRNKGYT